MKTLGRYAHSATRYAGLVRWWDRWRGEEVVFGKPQWFTKKRPGWGLVPARLPGWIYAAVWLLVMVVPFVLLAMRHRAPEAAIWLIGSIGMLTWDVRKLRRRLDLNTHPVRRETWVQRRSVPNETAPFIKE